MSTNPKKIQSGKNDKFNVEIGDKASDDKQIFDLNEIFHIDLSYNFDLLKNLLSTIIKNQKLKDDKLTELENQLLDLRIAFNESPNKIDPNKIDPNKMQTGKKEKKEKKLEGSFESESLKYVLKPPKKEPVLEESDQYQPIVNNIIVSL
jgi:hypothetical protein